MSGKRAGASGSSSNRPLIIGGVVLAAIVLIAGYYSESKPSKPETPKFGTAPPPGAQGDDLSEALVDPAEEAFMFGGHLPPRTVDPVMSDVPLNAVEAGKRERFLKWCDNVGVQWPHLNLTRSQLGGMGTFALKDFKPGDELVCLPSKLIPGESLFLQSGLAPLVALVPKQLSVTLFHAIFAARMLYDRESEPVIDKLYAPYFETWPDPSDLPIAWERDEYKKIGFVLEVSPADVSVLDNIIESHPQIFGSPRRPAYSHENLRRGLALTQSRAFGPITIRRGKLGGFHTETLIPAFDHLNHEFRAKKAVLANTYREWWHSKDEKRLCLKAKRHIKKGEEVFNYYGSESSMKFWNKYGFVTDDDTQDQVTFLLLQQTYRVPRSFARPYQDAASSDVSDTTGQYFLFIKEKDGHRFLPWARAFILRQTEHKVSDEEFTKLLPRIFCSGPVDFETCGVSKDHENAARRSVVQHMHELIETAGNVTGLHGEYEFVRQHSNDPAMQRDVSISRLRYRMKMVLLKSAEHFKRTHPVLP